MASTHGGKGSDRRPTNSELYEKNWEIIFGKKDLANGEENDLTNEKIPAIMDVQIKTTQETK